MAAEELRMEGRRIGHAVTRLARAALRLVSVRLRLAAVEVEAEVQRVSRMLLFGVIAGLFGLLALVFAAVLVLAVYWDTHRVAAAAGIVLALVVACLIAIARFVKLRRAPSGLKATRLEFERDLEVLRGSPR
jgi:uncharacterized membrane protein YqjE